MINLETNYLGLKLRNPLIISSSGMTNSLEKLKKLEEAGAGAIVLKSLFEEQINFEAGKILNESHAYPEAEDYIRTYSKSNTVDDYLELIQEAKKTISIPVIASINCVSDIDWTGFANKIAQAGADALELNIHIVSVDPLQDASKLEEKYLSIVEKVKEATKLPLAVKIGSHFSNLTHFVAKLYHRKVEAVVLFNRFYQPDIDIHHLNFTSAGVFSSPDDLRNTLRWIGIVSSKVEHIELSASTGIHDGTALIKCLLAGAQTGQICSVLYKNGFDEIGKILQELKDWMEEMNYDTIDDFQGIMNYSRIKNPAVYERSQFMRYFSSHE